MIMTLKRLAQSSKSMKFTGIALGKPPDQVSISMYQAGESFHSSACGARSAQTRQRAEESTEETVLWDDADVSEEQTHCRFHS